MGVDLSVITVFHTYTASSFPPVPSPLMHMVLPSAPSPPLAPEASPPLPDMISAEDVVKVKKAAKYAVNAPDYDHLDTERARLGFSHTWHHG